MLARIGSGDGLRRVLRRHRADVHHLDVSGEKLVEVRIALDFSAMLGADLRLIQFSPGVDCGDLRVGSLVERVNMSTRCPTVSDDADVVFFHTKRVMESEGSHLVNEGKWQGDSSDPVSHRAGDVCCAARFRIFHLSRSGVIY